MSGEGWRGRWSVLSDGEDPGMWVHSDAADAWVVLAADPEEVERIGSLPSEGVVAEAPMGEYDVLELSVFAQPVARVRWMVDDESGRGAVSSVQRVGTSGETDLPDEQVIPVLVEAALDELWSAGAEEVTTVVRPEQAEGYTRTGWVELERVARGA